MDSEFIEKCRCGGNYRRIPDSPILLSYPAQYHVECVLCKSRSISAKISEVEEIKARFGNINLLETDFYEEVGPGIINVKALGKIELEN